MAQFVRIGESIINLDWIRAVEYAGDGRMNVWLSEDRATGLVLRFSGDEAQEAWTVLTASKSVALLNPPKPSNGSADGSAQAP